MTRINKLVINGFKSFANKTELIFGDTFNCVLGPNGSGKSNVLDAICFVLGRMSSKSLRAEKSSNLIFNGGKNKKAPEKGEVSLYLDNTKKIFPVDTEEVKVTRLIKSSGQSVYKINDKTRTRNEVVDLLSAARIDPDGYNIILQNDIMRFVEMSPVERRQIVEEASGISVYEERKHQSLLELEKVEKKLNEAEIILNERKTYLKELKKDRDQALKFKEVKDQISSSKATYTHIQMERKKETCDKLAKDVVHLQEKFTQAEQKITDYRALIQQKKDEIQKLAQDIEHKGEIEQVKLSKEIENMRVELEKQKTRVRMIKDELVKIQQRKSALNKDVQETIKGIGDLEGKKKQLGQQKTERERELQDVEQKIATFKKRNQLDALGNVEKDVETLDKEIEKKQEEIQKVRMQQQELLREKDKLEFQIQSLDDQVKKVQEVEKENKQQVDNLKSKRDRFKQVTLELNTALSADSRLAAQVSDARKQMLVLQEEKAKLEGRQVAVQERVGGDMAIKKILELKKKKTGIYGTVAELGQVSKKYSLPLEIAAGQRLMSIVVEDDKIAAECIKYLKENKFGVATFIPLNKIRAPEIKVDSKVLKQEGVHDLCVNLVTFDKKLSKAFAYVFGDTFVVDTIDVARRIGIGTARMVSLDGDLADYSGVMRGGYSQKRVGAFVESDLVESLRRVEAELAEFGMSLDHALSAKERNEKLILSMRQEKFTLEAELGQIEKVLHLASGDIDATKQQKETLRAQLKDIEKKLADFSDTVMTINRSLAEAKTKKEQLKIQVSQLRNPHLLAELRAFEEARQKAREHMLEIKNESDTIDLQIKNVMLSEKDRIGYLLKGHEKEETSFSAELKGLEEKIKTGEVVLKDKDKAYREFFSAYKDLFHQRDTLNTEINELENKTENTREQSRKVEIEMNNFSLKLAAARSELSGLETQFEQFKDAKLLRGKSEEDLKEEIGRFERVLSTMSAVNMKALEIYEQVEVEYGKLIEKRETLLIEKKDVNLLMDEIEGKKKEQFMITFKELNDNFQQKFALLSKKGSAFLQLENVEKPFEAGLNVRVRLTGQRYLDIKSLSGGEKTLTALAFIFSIQEYHPHSFYIMDEVDAALDKHNSEKLAKLIRQYSTRAQYLIISHNDSLISEADTLYGVSMDETGISKVVSLKV